MIEPTSPSASHEEDYQKVLDTARRLLIQSQALSGRLHHMQRIVSDLNRAATDDEVLAAISAHVHWLLKFDHCSICLQKSDDACELRTLSGHPLVHDSQTPTLLYQGAENFTDTISIILSDYASQLIIPLESENVTLGTLNFASFAPDAFSLEDRRTANLLAAQAANGLRNVLLLQDARRAREESEHYLAQLEADSSEANEFSYAVAHDLKTPLNLLTGYVSLLQLVLNEYDDPEVQSYLKEVELASKNMARIIDQLLWLAQLQNARTAAVPVDMSSVAQRSLWRFTPELKRRNITIEIAPDMPYALGQDGWIEEIFANLIGNAVKYIGDENENPRIEVNAAPAIEDGAARYEITDNGIGIAEQDQQRIFELFTRLRLAGSDGHGLGLSIVSRIVQRLGGEVGVRSIPGAGSTFWFTLPAA